MILSKIKTIAFSFTSCHRFLFCLVFFLFFILPTFSCFSTESSHGSKQLLSIEERLFRLQMSSTPAAAIGGAVGALALIALLFLVLWFCIFRHKNASETTGSSDPSSQGNVLNHKSHQPPSLSLTHDLDFCYLCVFFRRKKCCNGVVNERIKKV